MKHLMNLFASCTLAALMVSAAVAQKPTPPPPGPPKPFTVPKAEKFTLPNGLAVTMVPYGTIPKVEVMVAVRAGNLNEAAEQVWLADLTGELLKEGTKGKTSELVDQQFARMGGRLDVQVTPDQTLISTDVLGEYAPDAARLLAEVITTPRLPASELPRLKADAQRRLAVAKTQPRQIALERFRKLLYGDHPYGRVFPTEQMLAKYTIDDAQKFYSQNFGAARTHIYVAGKFDPAAVKSAITQTFAKWARGPAPLVNIPKANARRTFDLIERPGAVQSTLYLGLPVVDPSHADYIPLQVTNAMLGGSFISRITQNIRENKGYTYSPFSQLSARYRDTYWLEVADVTTAVTGPSLKEIFGEIEGMRKQPPPADELTRIQRYLSGVFVLQNSTRQGVIGRLNFVDLHGLGDDYLRTFVQKVNAVTGADVHRMAQKYVDPERMTLVIVGDKPKISDQVAPYAQVSMKQ